MIFSFHMLFDNVAAVALPFCIAQNIPALIPSYDMAYMSTGKYIKHSIRVTQGRIASTRLTYAFVVFKNLLPEGCVFFAF
jgi:hypothetical protein